MSDAPAPPTLSPEELAAAWAAAEAEAERELAEADARAAEEAARIAAGGLPTPAPAPAPVPAAPRRSRARQLLAACLVVGCAVGGAAANGAFRAKVVPPEVATATDESGSPIEPKLPPADPAVASRIDLLIRAGFFPDALRACREAPKNAFGDEAPLAYRHALCYEGLGKWKDADLNYQKAEKDANVGAWARALLGRARCATATGSFPEARAFIDRVLLRAGHPECKGARVYEEAVHLRAHVTLAEAGPRPAPDALDAEALAWPVLRTPADKCLDWLPTDQPPASPVPDAGRDVVELHRDKDAPGKRDVTARLSKRPALDVVRAIAAVAELEVRVEAPVAALLNGIVGPVEVERLPLDEVLSALTERVGVAWAIKGDELELTRAPRPRSADAAADALRQALALPAEHPSAGATRVALANLDAQAGRLRAAAQGYKQVLESGETGPEVTHAAYNFGLLELQEGNRKGSQARFLQVIDRNPRTHWAELAWFWIGRAHLEDNNLDSARDAYRKGLDGKNREVTSAAALGLCACDLLMGDYEAVKARFETARFSTRESHAQLAKFYEALVQYRTAPTESRRERLLTALRSADEGRGLGPAGVYLVGRVYFDIGLPQKQTELYEATVETARGPLALQMLFETAERYDRLDQRKPARTRYQAVAAADPMGLGALAELRLAALDAREGNATDALRRCRALVNRPGVPRTELLAVMGRGYELQKKYGLAAECFAGRLPAE